MKLNKFYISYGKVNEVDEIFQYVINSDIWLSNVILRRKIKLISNWNQLEIYWILIQLCRRLMPNWNIHWIS